MNTIGRDIRYWAGKKYPHLYFLVFDDRTQPVDITSWETASKTLEDAPKALGYVCLAAADQPKGPFDPNTFRGKFGTTTHCMGCVQYDAGPTLAEAARIIRTTHALRTQERQRYAADPVYALEEELKVCDWTSHYSDDPGVARAGEQHMQKIQALKAKVDPEVATALFAKYQPKF